MRINIVKSTFLEHRKCAKKRIGTRVLMRMIKIMRIFKKADKVNIF